jgi:hypothetical protein
MAKRPTDFAQQNTERAIEVANYSLNWMREIAERNLSESRAALEDLLTITRKAADGIDHQASVIREHSISFMERTLSNSFDFAQKVLHMREPQELAELQSEFVSRQAQVLGDQTKEFGHHAGSKRGGKGHAGGDCGIIATAVRGRITGPARSSKFEVGVG